MYPDNVQPADLYPAFRWERLIALGELAWEARTYVSTHAVPADSVCGIGLRGWEHTKHAIIKAAAKEHADWLSVTDSGAKFRFKADMMPIRFCRGDHDEPLPKKYAFADPVEQEQIELAFGAVNHPTTEGFFRLLIDADKQGTPLGIYLVLANLDGGVRISWRIPRASAQSGATPIVIPQTPITLGPLKVRTVAEIEEEKKRLAEEAEQKAKTDKNSKERGA